MRYDVAISFAGEQRFEARAIAKCLSDAGLKVFFDEYEDAMLWGEDLYERLSDVYQNQAGYCITLVSKAYAEKLWTSHERKNAQARALKETKAYILPVRFDDTEIPGLAATIGYLDYGKYGSDGVCAAFLRKLGRAHQSDATRSVQVAHRSPFALIHPVDPAQWLTVPVERARWALNKINMTLEPDDPADGPILSTLKIGGAVFVAYGFDVAQCKLIDRTQISEGTAKKWELVFEIEKTDFVSTFEFNFGAESPNQLAEKRARRILLNEDPAIESNDINKALIEHYTARGQGSPIAIQKSILPMLFREFGNQPERFLGIAWIWAIAMLRLSGAVADVMKLEIALDGEDLKVDFIGRRKKEYANQPAFEVRVAGKCSLSN